MLSDINNKQRGATSGCQGSPAGVHNPLVTFSTGSRLSKTVVRSASNDCMLHVQTKHSASCATDVCSRRNHKAMPPCSSRAKKFGASRCQRFLHHASDLAICQPHQELRHTWERPKDRVRSSAHICRRVCMYTWLVVQAHRAHPDLTLMQARTLHDCW